MINSLYIIAFIHTAHFIASVGNSVYINISRDVILFEMLLFRMISLKT